jgi:uncharacterized membrane protein YdjX (TVP38/TMEM64 family)
MGVPAHRIMKFDRLLKGLLAVVLILGLITAAYRWDLSAWLHPQQIRGLLDQAGMFAPLLYMMLMALAVVITIIPSLPLNVAAGIYFGPIMGTLFSALGALAGAVLSFLIARYLGREFIERFLTGHINFCTECSDHLLTKIVFISRLLPFVSFDLVSYGAGLTMMSLRAFSVATFFGCLPFTFIYNYFGSIFVMSRSLTFFFGFVMLLLFFGIPWLIERYDLFSLRRFFQHGEN